MATTDSILTSLLSYAPIENRQFQILLLHQGQFSSFQEAHQAKVCQNKQ